MGRIYAVPFTATVTAAGGNTDLWQLTPADDKPIRLRGLRLGQTSEVGDAAEEGVSLSIMHLAATVTDAAGTGSTSVTPVPVDKGVNVAAGFTALVNSPTVATTNGAATVVEELAWNLRNSPCDLWAPDRDFCPTARQGAALVIRLNSPLGDDITFCGTAWVEEE